MVFRRSYIRHLRLTVLSLLLRDLMGRFADEAERCIRCGFCNSVCPTSLTGIGYKPSKTSRGRLVLLQSALERGTPNPFTPRFLELIDLCIGCMRCVNVCPARIPIPTVMSSYRRAYLKALGVSSLPQNKRILLGYATLIKTLAKAPRPVRRLLISRPVLYTFKRLAGFAPDSPLPAPEDGALDRIFKIDPPRAGYKLYAYFSDTFARYVRPSIGLSARELLRTAGIDLYYPRQQDSGILNWELGAWEDVERLASRNVETLAEEVAKGRQILSTSPATTLMLREVYPTVLDDERSRAVSEAVVDINELIHALADSGKLSMNLEGKSCTVHSSCFSQHLQLTRHIIEALEALNVDVRKVATECCGSGGLWGFLEENRRLSLEIGGRLLERIGDAETVISYSETCSLQILSLSGGGLDVHLPHEVINSWRRRNSSLETVCMARGS